MASDHNALLQRAEEALIALISDTSVGWQQTRDDLESLIATAQTAVDAMESEHENDE